jgi:hypothetical protein
MLDRSATPIRLVSYDQVRDPDDRRRVRSIVITRSRGALRQQRLRAAQLQITTPEELCATSVLRPISRRGVVGEDADA